MGPCDRVIERPMMTVLFVFLALSNTAPIGAVDGSQTDLELQEKFDLGWAQEQLSHAKSQAGKAYSKAIKASKDATNLTADVMKKLKERAAEAGSKVSNVTEKVTSKLGKKAKREAFWAVLMYLGKCPDYYSYIPRVPAAVAPVMARTFQQWEEDPSSNVETCTAAVTAAIHKEIDDRSEGTSEKEVVAMKWITADRAKVVCKDDLMSELRLFETIRQSHAPQYKAAVIDRLLLRVVTQDLLTSELDMICGGQSSVGLFAEHGKVLPAASVPGPRLPLLALVACTTVIGLVTAASVVSRRFGRNALWQTVRTTEQHSVMTVEE